MGADVTVRDAATILLIRDPSGPEPRVLMGQRGTRAAFMPNKFVFPGGAVDPEDDAVPVLDAGREPDLSRLAAAAPPARDRALFAAAIRELWEETGLIIGTPGVWPAAEPVPETWRSFAASGHVPSAKGLSFVFRAITPKGRPRRFDARFFLADANIVAGDPDDFSRASDELAHLQWVPLDRVQRLDLPFITQVVMAETAARLPDLGPPTQVPFFRNDDETRAFERLAGAAPVA